MRAIIQRVNEARIESHGEQAAIGRGLAVLLGVGANDAENDCVYIARKIAGLRVFEDSGGKMNLALGDVGGEVLLVSQFTLYGDCRRGRRPSFTGAAPPAGAEVLYERVAALLRGADLTVRTGFFQRHMHLILVNDGPVTLLLDSEKTF